VRNLPTRVLVAAGLLVALLLAGIVSYYASRSPDGLNRVAGDHGFDETQSTTATADGPLAGYRTKGIDDARLSGGIAGVTGVLLVLVLAGGLTYAVRRGAPPERD
jgi:cobalt/nickel transport system permease protein/cobalt/nickel transport protein